MKILVTVKRVEDYESKIKVKPDNSWIVTDGVNYRANPFDEIAVEEALRLRDSNIPSEVVVVSVGPAAAAAEIRSGLAMGADRASSSSTTPSWIRTAWRACSRQSSTRRSPSSCSWASR